MRSCGSKTNRVQVSPYSLQPFRLQPEMLLFLMCSHPTRSSCNCRKRQERGGVSETKPVSSSGIIGMLRCDSIVIL